MKVIYEIPIKKQFSKEKETYPYLQKYIFNEAVKLYTPVLCGFPDFIAVSYKEPHDKILKPAFVEVKLNKGKLSIHQEKFLAWLKKGFEVYVFHIYTQENGSIIQVKEV
ncbi:MAG: VRR-NUC domain-containing protein [Sulfurihydrogenibium sp.]|jgi:hypothetical protein|nr:VRR-NUC domain-containing protein [Sulfurihydrogenibium sp.]